MQDCLLLTTLTTIRFLPLPHLLYFSIDVWKSRSLTVSRRMSLKRALDSTRNDDSVSLQGENNSVGDPALKRIAQSPSSKLQPTPLTEISVATYNIWFGTTGHEARRMEAILDALSPHEPTLIGFQEVTPKLAQMLCPLLESLNYHTILQPFMSYGCAVACKVDSVLQSGFHPFSNSEMDRGIVWALVQVDGREILFTTAHLESYFDSSCTGGPEREVQLLEMIEFCERCLRERPTAELAVITGDLNWDDERARSDGHNRKLLSLVDGTKWFDAYRQVEPQSPGFTYDPEENPMLGGGNIRRRFDRILVHTRDRDKVGVSSVDIVGKEALPGLTYTIPPTRYHGPKTRLVAPSDHFGLVSALEF